MPEQELFFEKHIGEKRITVVKTYDESYAREAFNQMLPDALLVLGASLALDTKYDIADLPSSDDEDFPDALWDEMHDAAREEWNLFSYFVVQESSSSGAMSLYVSPDWPSAEAFAERLLDVASAH